jgi:hypothetical protein
MVVEAVVVELPYTTQIRTILLANTLYMVGKVPTSMVVLEPFTLNPIMSRHLIAIFDLIMANIPLATVSMKLNA